VIKGDKAIIARPSEAVLSMIENGKGE